MFLSSNFSATRISTPPFISSPAKSTTTSTASAAPLVAPVLHDKLFFFFSYAGFRYISDNVFVPTVPSQAMLNGDFTENTPMLITTPDNQKCVIAAQSASKFWACNPYLPKATAWCGAANGPNPGKNICPTSLFDPAIMNILKAGLIPTSTAAAN